MLQRIKPSASRQQLEWLEVVDQAAARLLMKERALEALSPFLGPEPMSLSEAAAITKSPPTSLAYWVNQLYGAGLIGTAFRKKRAGAPITYYRAAAKKFYVSYSALPDGAVADFLERAHHRLHQQIERSIEGHRGPEAGKWGLKIARNPSGAVTVVEAPPPGKPPSTGVASAPAILTLWDILELNPSDAKSLQRELQDLLEGYRSKGGSQRHLLRIAMAPVREE